MIEPFLKLLWHIEISITFHKAYNPYCLVGTKNYAQYENTEKFYLLGKTLIEHYRIPTVP